MWPKISKFTKHYQSLPGIVKVISHTCEGFALTDLLGWNSYHRSAKRAHQETEQILIVVLLQQATMIITVAHEMSYSPEYQLNQGVLSQTKARF